MYNPTQKLKADLEYAATSGVRLFKAGEPTTPEDVAFGQWVNEKNVYMPEFIVKDEGGNITEIWYGESTVHILRD